MSTGGGIEIGGNINTLGGVAITSPVDGQILIYVASTQTWVNANNTPGAASLAGLTDVTLTSPMANDFLVYNGTKWVNLNPSLAQAAIGLAIGTNVEAWSATLDAVAAGTYTGATSITTLGTISTGLIPIANGGTGQTTNTLGFDALSPLTTKGDIVVYNGTHNVRMGVGTDGQVLQANSGAATGVSWTTNPAGVPAQIVYVDPNGSDSTGTGSPLLPFLTIGHALSTITTSSSTKPYVVQINPGTYSETGLEIPVWVFLNGSAQQPTKIIDSSGAIKINSASFSAGSERIGFSNLNLINSTGITVDFQAIGGAGSNQVYLNNNQIVGPVIFRGRGSDALTSFDNRFFGTYTSSAMQEEHFSGYFANTVTFNSSGVTGVAVSPGFTSMSFFSNATFTSSGAGNTMTPTMVSCPQSGTLTVDQATTTLSADEVSLNAATLSQTNGGLITYLSLAKYEGYTPATSVNWNTVPTVVSTALDDLATSGIYKSQTANTVLAAPSGSAGLPSFRTLTAADLPSILYDNVRYIDWVNGSDVTGDGSQQRPWQSLQHAYTTIGIVPLNYPYTIVMEPGFDSVDVGTITGHPNINLICIGGIANIPRPVNITGGTTNDVMSITNVNFSNATNPFTWTRNDATDIDLFIDHVIANGTFTFEQQGSGVSGTLFQADLCTFVGLSVQANEIAIFGSFFEGNTLAVADSGAAFFQCLSSYFYNTAITFAGGIQAGFGGCLLDNTGAPISITGTTTGSGTPAIFSDSSSIPATIAGAYSILGLTSQAKYVNSNYTPVNYTAVTTDVTGNLHGIDNALAGFSPGAFPWTSVAGTSQTLAANNGYFAANGSLTTFTLPATATVGDTFRISADGAGLFTVAQNAGQSIRYGNQVTTVGTGGNITATSQGDTLTIVCKAVNTGFQVIDSEGMLNIT